MGSSEGNLLVNCDADHNVGKGLDLNANGDGFQQKGFDLNGYGGNR